MKPGAEVRNSSRLATSELACRFGLNIDLRSTVTQDSDFHVMYFHDSPGHSNKIPILCE